MLRSMRIWPFCSILMVLHIAGGQPVVNSCFVDGFVDGVVYSGILPGCQISRMRACVRRLSLPSYLTRDGPLSRLEPRRTGRLYQCMRVQGYSTRMGCGCVPRVGIARGVCHRQGESVCDLLCRCVCYLPTQQGAWRWRSSGRTGWGEAPWLINCYSACADVGHLEEPLQVPKYLVQSDISTWGDARCILPWPYTAGRWSRVWVAAVTLWLRAGLAPLVVW